MTLMKDFHGLSTKHKKQVRKLVNEHHKKISFFNNKIAKIKSQNDKMMKEIQSISAEKQRYLDELQELQKFMRKR